MMKLFAKTAVNYFRQKSRVQNKPLPTGSNNLQLIFLK